jgi:hypothetical protein
MEEPKVDDKATCMNCGRKIQYRIATIDYDTGFWYHIEYPTLQCNSSFELFSETNRAKPLEFHKHSLEFHKRLHTPPAIPWLLFNCKDVSCGYGLTIGAVAWARMCMPDAAETAMQKFDRAIRKALDAERIRSENLKFYLEELSRPLNFGPRTQLTSSEVYRETKRRLSDAEDAMTQSISSFSRHKQFNARALDLEEVHHDGSNPDAPSRDGSTQAGFWKNLARRCGFR